MTTPSNSKKQLELAIRRIAGKIGASSRRLPAIQKAAAEGGSQIEVDSHGFHYIVKERGELLERRTTRSQDELLYWIFVDMTRDMAFEDEVQQRQPGRDPRRFAFGRQIELLSALNTDWAQRRKSEIASLLRDYPYDDQAIRRLDASKGAS